MNPRAPVWAVAVGCGQYLKRASLEVHPLTDHQKSAQLFCYKPSLRIRVVQERPGCARCSRMGKQTEVSLCKSFVLTFCLALAVSTFPSSACSGAKVNLSYAAPKVNFLLLAAPSLTNSSICKSQKNNVVVVTWKRWIEP